MTSDKNYLTPIYTSSVVQNIIDRLTDALINGSLKPGDKLPTEPELAKEFGVGRNSIREAVRILVSYGILEIRRADGTYVCSGFSLKMINPLLYGMILQKDRSHGHLLDLRKLIESGVLQLIVERGITQEYLDRIEERYQNLEQLLTIEHPIADTVLEADISFHQAIADSTENPLIIQINELIAILTRSSRQKTILDLLQSKDTDTLIQTHHKILQVIKDRDKDGIEDALAHSYLYWKEYVF